MTVLATRLFLFAQPGPFHCAYINGSADVPKVLKRRPERLSVTGAGFSDMAAGDARLDGSLSTFTIPSMWNEGMPARFNPFFISALAAASVLLAYPLLRYFSGDRDAQLKDWEPVQKLRRRGAH